jgi:hypothetical protein
MTRSSFNGCANLMNQLLGASRTAAYSSDTLDQAFDRLSARLAQPVGEATFWFLLQPIVTRLHCGHTRVQHSAAYRARARQRPVGSVYWLSLFEAGAPNGQGLVH